MANEVHEIIEGLTTELKRGSIVLGVLASLKEKQYGYSLSQAMEERGMAVDQNTLYPLLRRLEKQGLLISDWTIEDSRPRRYYQLNETGRIVLARLKEEWAKMAGVMDHLLK